MRIQLDFHDLDGNRKIFYDNVKYFKIKEKRMLELKLCTSEKIKYDWDRIDNMQIEW